MNKTTYFPVKLSMEICDTLCEFTKICLTLLLSQNCGTSVPDDNDTHGMVLTGH